MGQTITMPTCPMAETCKGMMDKPRSGILMLIPGLILIVLGVSIIMYPQILAWFLAIALIVMGIAMILMVNFMRKFGKRMQNRHG